MSVESFIVGSLLVGAGLAALEKLIGSLFAGTPAKEPALKQVHESLQIGGKRFSFRYEYLSKNRWQIRATHYPPIKNPARSRKATVTHVYSDGRICVTRDPKTIDQAKAIARYWATGYVAYLETGVFPDAGGSVEV